MKLFNYKQTFAFIIFSLIILLAINESQSKKHKGKRIKKHRKVQSTTTKDEEKEKKKELSFFSYDPKKTDHILILDNSLSLNNKFKGGSKSRRDVVQEILNSFAEKNLKISFCIALPRNDKHISFKKVKLFYEKEPPILTANNKVNYLGISSCFSKIAKLENRLNKEIFTHIHIVTDGYYRPEFELEKEIKDFKRKKSFSADIIGDDPNAIDMINQWIANAHGINKGIQYQFGEVITDEKPKSHGK